MKKQFQPGQSGNPAGSPKGSLNRTTLMAKALVGGQVEEIINRVLCDATYGSEKLRMRLLPFLIQWLLPENRSEEVANIPEKLDDLERRVMALEEQGMSGN
jgi:Family of unknown function (DUF5681)